MARRERPFKGRQFTSEVILWAVRWYLQFPISYRDLELMLRDRGVSVDHTTIYRWIQAYAVELEKRLRPHLRPTNGSWRVDETYRPLPVPTAAARPSISGSAPGAMPRPPSASSGRPWVGRSRSTRGPSRSTGTPPIPRRWPR